MKIESKGPSLFNPLPPEVSASQNGNSKGGRGGEAQRNAERDGVFRDGWERLPGCSMGVLGCVRSKECFGFILVGVVLFKFDFDFGGCAFLPLVRIPRDWCCSAYVALRTPPQLCIHPSPWIPSCLLVSAGETIAYGPVSVCLPCWRTSWGAVSELHCISPGVIDCPPLTYFRKPRRILLTPSKFCPCLP